MVGELVLTPIIMYSASSDELSPSEEVVYGAARTIRSSSVKPRVHRSDDVRSPGAALCCLSPLLPCLRRLRPHKRPMPPSRAEDYRAEIAAGVWSASPDVVITSGTLGIDGSAIDFVGDLGLIRKTLPQLRLVLKAAPRHKLRIGYVPTSYEAGTTLSRTISFGSTNFTVGVPVTASLAFHAWRFGYQDHVVSEERGFAGLVAEVRYATVGADVRSTFLGVESSLGDAFIPAVGGTRAHLSASPGGAHG